MSSQQNQFMMSAAAIVVMLVVSWVGQSPVAGTIVSDSEARAGLATLNDYRRSLRAADMHHVVC